MTANAWPVTTGILYELDSTLPRPSIHPSQEVIDAFWLPIEEAKKPRYMAHTQ